jgi:peptide/nickel transport system permease protein
MFGGRTSLGTALVVAFFAVVLAAIISALAGLAQGFWDFIADPIGSFLAALPDVAILMIFSKVVGGLPMAVLILVVLGRLYGERVIRFATLAMRDDSDSMQRAGIGEIIPALGVVAALCAGSTVAIETAVSYLGLGVQPPTPSWGNMLSNAQQYFFSAPWLVFYPGMFILLTVLCCYVVADDLRHATAPGWR